MKWHHYVVCWRDSWILTDINQIAIHDRWVYQGEAIVYEISRLRTDTGIRWEEYRPPLAPDYFPQRRYLSAVEGEWIVANRELVAMERML